MQSLYHYSLTSPSLIYLRSFARSSIRTARATVMQSNKFTPRVSESTSSSLYSPSGAQNVQHQQHNTNVYTRFNSEDVNAPISSSANYYPFTPTRQARTLIYNSALGMFMDPSNRQPVNSPHFMMETTMRNNTWCPDNLIYRDRIISGRDVRTTIMLRNIPVNMDYSVLKSLLDSCCRNTYDFIYLSIDFSTRLNFGYAFINFFKLEGIVNVIDCIVGQPWKGYSSSKYAGVSYATTQGKEALVQKFRNSSITWTQHRYRPNFSTLSKRPLPKATFRASGLSENFRSPTSM